MSSHDHHHPSPRGGRRLLFAVGLTAAFALIELIGGVWSGSLALIGDAGHMITDSVALALAAWAAYLSVRPPSARHSYGLLRAEVVAALLNAVLMLAVVAGITLEALERLRNPVPVMGGVVMAVAGAGLAVNVTVAVVLSRGESTLNIRGALLHVFGDMLGSIAALTAGAVIHFTGWTPIDPLLALLVAGLIVISTLRLLRDVMHVVMEGVPPHLDLPAIGHEMAGVEHVTEVHDLHIWTLASGHVVLTAHVVLDRFGHWQEVQRELQQLLSGKYGIDHLTLQPETTTFVLHPLQRK